MEPTESGSKDCRIKIVAYGGLQNQPNKIFTYASKMYRGPYLKISNKEATCVLEGEGGRSGKRHTKELGDRRRHVVYGRIVRLSVGQVDIEAEFPHRLLLALQ